MKNIPKIKVKQTAPAPFYGLNLDQAMHELEELKKYYSSRQDTKDFVDEICFCYDEYSSYECELRLVFYRLETDKEYEKRLKVIAKSEERRKMQEPKIREREFKQYQRLKKKFDGIDMLE